MIRIIIVDDHEIVREGLRSILQAEADFEVVAEAGSAEELGDLVDKTHPDVVLLDARLPGIDGAEACRRLVAARPDVAVLIVSTYSDDNLVEECIRAGARGYVVKDIERFSLKESIRPCTVEEERFPRPLPPRSSIGCEHRERHRRHRARSVRHS